MPKSSNKKQTFRVVGTQPVVVDGKRLRPDEVFDAHPNAIAFLIEVGAVRESAAKKD